jgi:hypothetical protein
LNLEEMQRMFLRPDGKGGKTPWLVSDQEADRPAAPLQPPSSLTSAFQSVRRRLTDLLYPSHPADRR